MAEPDGGAPPAAWQIQADQVEALVCADQTCVLWNGRTRERVELPDSADAWEWWLDEDTGLLLLRHHGQDPPEPAINRFTWHAYQRATTAEASAYNSELESWIGLPAYTISCCKWFATLPLGGPATTAKITVYCWPYAARGDEWSWSISDVLRNTLLPRRRGRLKSQAARIVHERLSSWDRLLTWAGIGEVRRSRKLNAALAPGNDDFVITDDELQTGRVLNENTISSAGLVCILLRLGWFSPQLNGCKDRLAKDLSKTFLLSVVTLASNAGALNSLFFVGSPDLQFSASGDLFHEDGQRTIRLPIDGALQLHLQGWRAWLRGCVARPRSLLGDRHWLDEVALTDFIGDLAECPSDRLARSLFVQLSHQLGRALCKTMRTKSRELNKTWLELGDYRGLTPAAVHNELVRYVSAGRETAKQFPHVVSVGLDASRVGMRNRMSVMFAFPNDVGFWAPPLVHGAGQAHRFQRLCDQFHFAEITRLYKTAPREFR